MEGHGRFEATAAFDKHCNKATTVAESSTVVSLSLSVSSTTTRSSFGSAKISKQIIAESASQQPQQERLIDRGGNNFTTTTNSDNNSTYYPPLSASTVAPPLASALNRIRNTMDQDPSESSTLEGSGYSFGTSLSDRGTNSIGTKSNALSSIGVSSLSNDNTTSSSLSDVMYTHARRRALHDEEHNNNNNNNNTYKNDKNMDDYSMSGKKFMERKLRRQRSEGRRRRMQSYEEEDEQFRSRLLPSTGFASYPEETKATFKDLNEEKDHDDDDANSIVSLSAKNLLERKQRKQMAIAKLREKSQRNSLLLHHPEMTITVVPETKATLKPKPTTTTSEQSKNQRRPSFTDVSLGMSTIATRDLDDDDSELVLSPIQEKTAACWRRHQPNVRPERKASMGMASVLEDETPATPPTRMKGSSCSVVSEDDDDNDDDDEESLSPLQVNLPKEKVQAALEKLHRSQPFHQALAPPLTQGTFSEVSRRSMFEAPLISQDVRSSRRGMFEKAKSVSHLEQKLMALPSNKNDNDQYDFLKFHPTKPARNNDNLHLPHVTLPLTTQKPTTPKTSSFQGQRSVDDPPERRGSRKPGECRSLSPVKNRWITGCQDGANTNNNIDMNPSQSSTPETAPPSSIDTGGWHLAVPSEHNHPQGPNQTLMLFRRSGTAPTPPPKNQDALVGLGTAPKSSRTKAENATFPPRRPSLSKSMSTPNLFKESKKPQELVFSTGGVVEPLPPAKIDSIVSFLLGEGLTPPKEEDGHDDEETTEETLPTAGKGRVVVGEKELAEITSVGTEEKEWMEEEGELNSEEGTDSEDVSGREDEAISSEDAKTAKKPTTDKEFTSKPFSLEELFSDSKPDASVGIAKSLPAGAIYSNLPSHGSIMQDYISSKTNNTKKRQSASPGLMKKIKNQVKAGTRYLRKKSYSVGEQDEVTRFSHSMSAFDSSYSGAVWRMEKLQEDFRDDDGGGGVGSGEGDELHDAEKHDDCKTSETTSTATSATSAEKSPPDEIVKIGKAIGAKLKKFPFMRSSSVPVLFVNDDDAPESETETTSAPLDVSLRGDSNTMEDNPKTAPTSPVPSKGTPRRTPRNSLSTKPPSIRNLEASPQVSPRQSLSPRLPVKDHRKLQTKERPSVKNLDEADHSSHTKSKSQRNLKSEKRRSSRRSSTSDKRSRSSSRKEKQQRSKSASSKLKKGKQSRQSIRKKSSTSPSPRSKSREDSSLRSYIAEKDAVNTCPHLTGLSSSSQRKSFGRQMSNRTLDNSRRSSLSRKSSGRERRNSRMQKAQSSRDVYQRRGKARTLDETSLAAARTSGRLSKKTKAKDRFWGSSVSSIDDVDASLNSGATSTRSSKMKGASKARSERVLGSSASSFEDDIDRSRSKAKRPSDSRRRTGSYSSLLSPPPPMRKSISARLVIADAGLMEDEEFGRQKRRSVASQAAAIKSASCRQLIGDTASTDEEEGSRHETNRRSIASRLSRPQETHRRMKKSQSLRHVDCKDVK